MCVFFSLLLAPFERICLKPSEYCMFCITYRSCLCQLHSWEDETLTLIRCSTTLIWWIVSSSRAFSFSSNSNESPSASPSAHSNSSLVYTSSCDCKHLNQLQKLFTDVKSNILIWLTESIFLYIIKSPNKPCLWTNANDFQDSFLCKMLCW